MKELLDAIYVDPADLQARQIYADWLLDRGDPRGEFIMLQCRHARSRAGKARERALKKRHWKKWAGVLADHISRKNLVFRRGFLAELELAIKPIPEPVLAAPEWATIEAVTLSRPLSGFMLSPQMRSLRSIVGIELKGLAEFAKAKHPIRAVSVRDWRFDEDSLRALEGLEALERFEHFGTPYSPAHIDALDTELKHLSYIGLAVQDVYTAGYLVNKVRSYLAYHVQFYCPGLFGTCEQAVVRTDHTGTLSVLELYADRWSRAAVLNAEDHWCRFIDAAHWVPTTVIVQGTNERQAQRLADELAACVPTCVDVRYSAS